MMKKYKITSVTQAASDVAVLTLTPRSDDDQLGFHPGQYASVGFKKRGRPTPMRCFSITSSPHDPRTLQFAMNVQGDFTKTAARLSPGTEAFVQGPYGSFVIDPDYDKRIVMIAGGIGITPFISMLRHAQATGLQIPVTLLYGVRSQRNIPFYAEILELEKKIPNLRVAFFVSDGAVTQVPGARFLPGKINKSQLEQAIGGNWQETTYFICGPKGFMRDLQDILAHKGVAPHRIVSESFTQSNKLTLGRFSIPKLTYMLTAGAFVLGFGFFMALDLARFLSKETEAKGASQSTTTITTPASSPSGNSNSTSTTDSSSSPSANTNTQNSSSGSSAQSTQQRYQYRQPISSMS